jgi:hypothetical protein
MAEYVSSAKLLNRVEKEITVMLRYIGVLLLACSVCCANELPDSPKPKPDAVKMAPELNTSRFWTRDAKVAGVATAGLLAADMAQTCHHLANGWREVELPSQSCAGTTAILAGETAAAWTGAYLAHKRGWHKVEKVLEWVMPFTNARGILSSH